MLCAIPRADVAGNVTRLSPALPDPALSCPLLAYGSTGHANAPMRNASGGKRSRWSLLQCGLRLSVNPDGLGNAEAAPNP